MNKILISEIGINHNGDLKIAKELIDVAKLGGCQYVKFQKRTVEDVYTKEELNKPRESPFGTTNREQKFGLEFEKEQYDEIERYCKEVGIKWFGSPWDVKSVDFLMQYKPDYIKVASAMLTNTELIEKIKSAVDGTTTKVIVSRGMSDELELDNCLELLGECVECIMHCTSTYPTKPEDMNMMAIPFMQFKYSEKYKIGFSNHSSGINFITLAAGLGVEMLEYHITMDRTMYGSDQAASIEPTGVFKIKKIIDSYDVGMGTGKLEILENEKPIREKLSKK